MGLVTWKIVPADRWRLRIAEGRDCGGRRLQPFFFLEVAFKAMWAEPQLDIESSQAAQETHHFLALVFKLGHYWGLECGIVPQTFPTHNVIQKGSPGLEINFKQG